MIELTDVTKVFPGMEKPAVDCVSFSIGAGETVVLLGSSGCGKSTTLKLINRLLVTHDLFEALTLGDRIGVMHEGRLEQIGTKAEIIKKPATDFVRELFEKPARQLAIFREGGMA